MKFISAAMKKSIQRFLFWIALFVLLLAAFVVRTYRIGYPLGDWHSFRQVDTAAVTREFVKNGIDVLHPHYHDVSNIQSGELNLEGWRMVEFPLLNAFTAVILQNIPTASLVETSRMVSIVSSMISLVLILYLSYRFWGKQMMFFSGMVFAFLPYSIYYSRVVLPEPFLVMWCLLTAVAIERWSLLVSQQEKNATYPISIAMVMRPYLWLILAAVSFGLALLVKPVAIFYIPFFIGIFWRNRPKHWLPWIASAILLMTSFLPLIFWRQWIQQFPSGIPASDWLFNGNGIRLRPAWWRWLFADRIGRLMFGYWGAALLPFGVLVGIPRMPKKLNGMSIIKWIDSWIQKEGVLLFGAVGMAAYLVIMATGNVQHDYYQILILPILALLWARTADWLITSMHESMQKITMLVGVMMIFLFSVVFAWYEVSGWFNVNNWAYVSAGEAIQRLTPNDALVIAPGFGDTTFLFQTERWGWPIGFEIEDKRAAGAQYYVSTAYDDEARMLENAYTVLEKTDEYIVIDLQQPKE